MDTDWPRFKYDLSQLPSYTPEIEAWLTEIFDRADKAFGADNYRVAETTSTRQTMNYNWRKNNGYCQAIDTIETHPETGRRFLVGYNYCDCDADLTCDND